MSELTHIRPDGLANNPAYTQVVAARGSTTVYISGQVSLDADGNTVGAGDLGAQTAQVMANLKVALGAAGATFDDVTKITTYVVNYQPADRAVIAAARTPYFTAGSPPASTLVGVAALAAPDWLIEIEAIAVIG
ncbi:MAG: RidA family protein [Acidimicrobiales bacterium]